jgi:hypothetical protein
MEVRAVHDGQASSSRRHATGDTRAPAVRCPLLPPLTVRLERHAQQLANGGIVVDDQQ